MARVCDVCGKGKMMGNNVSHANNRSKKIFFPNVQTVRVVTNGGTKRCGSAQGACVQAW